MNIRNKKESARLLQQSNAPKGVSQDPLIVSVFKAAVKWVARCMVFAAILALWAAAVKLVKWATLVAPVPTVLILFLILYLLVRHELGGWEDVR